MLRARRVLTACLAALILTACGPSVRSEAGFERWLAEEPGRAETFARFEASLRDAGVSDVVPNYQLWRSDFDHRQCVTEPYFIPPQELWANVRPALRFVRDHVVPAVGAVEVASSYRDPALNTCVRGASQSAHKFFHAMDLVPLNPSVSRKDLIDILCPIHAREGPRDGIGLGIYRARRFHIDGRGFRGWGEDFHRTTFPCA